MRESDYYVVAAEALPEVFRKVVEANRLLTTGEVQTVSEAVVRAQISRNAFYKYKDTVAPFNNLNNARIITFQAVLRDEPGVLSGILSILAGRGANILTINQNIPIDGCAAVNVSIEASGVQVALDELVAEALGLEGVLRLETLGAGNLALGGV